MDGEGRVGRRVRGGGGGRGRNMSTHPDSAIPSMLTYIHLRTYKYTHTHTTCTHTHTHLCRATCIPVTQWIRGSLCC